MLGTNINNLGLEFLLIVVYFLQPIIMNIIILTATEIKSKALGILTDVPICIGKYMYAWITFKKLDKIPSTVALHVLVIVVGTV